MMQDPDKANRAKSYRAGWKHAAAMKAIDPRLAEHADQGMREEYMLGYKDGYKARNEAVKAAYERIGYKPQILRLASHERPVPRRES